MPYEVHTPVFEGDLELLTQLVSRQELDVFGLCLASLVEAFLAEAKAAVAAGTESFDLDTSTEFLLLAATLVELKTRYLLVEDDDDVPDELPTPEDRDLLLATLTLYWTTGTITSSLLPYWASRHAAGAALPVDDASPVPTAVSVFGGERVPFARPPRSLAERYYTVTAWAEHAIGGHFPAVAEPDLLARTLHERLRPLI